MSRASTLQDKFSKDFQAAVLSNNTTFSKADVRTMLAYFLRNANVTEMEAVLAEVSMDQFDL